MATVAELKVRYIIQEELTEKELAEKLLELEFKLNSDMKHRIHLLDFNIQK